MALFNKIAPKYCDITSYHTGLNISTRSSDSVTDLFL